MQPTASSLAGMPKTIFEGQIYSVVVRLGPGGGSPGRQEIWAVKADRGADVGALLRAERQAGGQGKHWVVKPSSGKLWESEIDWAVEKEFQVSMVRVLDNEQTRAEFFRKQLPDHLDTYTYCAVFEDENLAESCKKAVEEKWEGNDPEVSVTKTEDADLTVMEFTHSHAWEANSECRRIFSDIVLEHKGKFSSSRVGGAGE